MQAATPAPGVTIGTAGPSSERAAGASARGSERRVRALQALGALGLLGIVLSALFLAAGAAGGPSQYVPARSGGWTGWLAGPLRGMHLEIGRQSFQALTLLMCAGYGAVLLSARRLPLRALLAAVVAAQVILALGPPLISQDVFGYLGFARMGALHGLEPYTHLPAEAPSDAVFPFIGWPYKHSPYGPLFTLASYATAPLSPAAGLWAFKALALVASLAAVALLARAASLLGRSRRFVVAFVGLNPVLLELALGGAHNDMLIVLALACALALSAGANPRLRAAAGALVAGVGVKVTAGLALPFLVLAPPRWRERLHVALGAGAALAALAALALLGFGTHAFGFTGALGEQQQLVATHSVPAETARLVGLDGTPGWWRVLFGAAFALALALALWRCARGAEWRAAAGWTALALLVCTAWLLPWYAVWALPLAAVGGDRRLRGATLVLCAYAILIHLPLADPILSAAHARPERTPAALAVPGDRLASAGARLALDVPSGESLEFARFQVVRDAARDLSR